MNNAFNTVNQEGCLHNSILTAKTGEKLSHCFKRKQKERRIPYKRVENESSNGIEVEKHRRRCGK